MLGFARANADASPTTISRLPRPRGDGRNGPVTITALERAVSDRSQMMGYMNVDPGLEPVLADPRVREISRRIRFD
jgi:hypothetical protein